MVVFTATPARRMPTSNLSAGLDFETKLFYKTNAAELLESELSKRNYRPDTIHLGASTDPYQPIERERRVTRQLLEVLWRFRHPVTIHHQKSPGVAGPGPAARDGEGAPVLHHGQFDDAGR